VSGGPGLNLNGAVGLTDPLGRPQVRLVYWYAQGPDRNRQNIG